MAKYINVEVDKTTSDLLAEMSIEFFGGKRKIKPGDVFRSRIGSVVEEYSRHPTKLLMHSGSFSYASDNGRSLLGMATGRYCSVAVGVRVMNGHHPMEALTTNPWHYGDFYKEGNIPADFVYRGERPAFPQEYGPVKVGHDVWVGSHCTLMSGKQISTGAVIAGGANVTSDVPPYAIVGGNPARIIRYRFPDEIIQRLLESKWWEISPKLLRDFNVFEVEATLDAIDRLRESGEAIEFTPRKLRVTANGLEEVS
ncbi:CatB-related O-acetyltransferase [uncultured Cohaesibacter sp.]|uniref:CatB-related O-acetyltransferase n=1 Tax=uncultured Cohaesibacter sp. TaxID=1002546 RepID=UPI002AAAB54B|nr:CatB-related O-acetyltransferase [uncultured Cohaesibacter sp.]